MEGLIGYIATGIVMLIVGILLRNLEPKAKIVYWSPHYFIFNMEYTRPPLRVQTSSLTIQNIGRKTAENVEIILNTKPDFFQFAPSIPFEETVSTEGGYLLCVKSLGPKEFFTIQLLNYKTLTSLNYIRSKEGTAQLIQIQPQRIYPRWVNRLSTLLVLIGAGFVIYWLIRAVIFISTNIGI